MASPLMVPFQHQDDPDLVKKRRLSLLSLGANSTTLPEGYVQSCEDAPACWICLDGARGDAHLLQPCKCPRAAHAHCLARWQLQSAGSRRETHCEFCDCHLPDWKHILTPRCGANAPAVMNVNFDGQTYSFEVKPGPDGYQKFTDAIRRAFTLPDDSELNITFTCDEPGVGPAPEQHPPPIITSPAQSASLLTLQGPGAYDAAVHCASVSAARRMLHTGPEPGPCRPSRSVPCPWTASQDGLPVRQALTEPPAEASTSQEASSSSQPPAGQAQGTTAQKEKNRKLRGIGKGINSLLTKLIPPKSHKEHAQQQQAQLEPGSLPQRMLQPRAPDALPETQQ